MKVQIKLNDGTTRVVDIGKYDAQKLATELNDSQNNYVAIGSGDKGVILQRYSVVRIEPADAVEEETGSQEG